MIFVKMDVRIRFIRLEFPYFICLFYFILFFLECFCIRHDTQIYYTIFPTKNRVYRCYGLCTKKNSDTLHV